MDEDETPVGYPCVICGGNNFYKESGFYFCTECQTQTQEIREQAFEEYNEQEFKATKKINTKQETQKSAQVKLTTWECYNYVLKGLTEELIVLGADILLRSVVKKLWLKYLLKIEVVNMEKPKLQAVNTKIDAEIIYGKRKKRKRKSRSSRASHFSESDLSTLDIPLVRRERIKRRRALIKAQYEHSFSKSVDSTIFNETLTTLKSTSDQSSQLSVPLRYNGYAKTELRKRQSELHLHQHCEDFENIMRCHQNSYTEASKVYQESAHLLSINKIYSILYLSLLLTKSKIQLSDLLRFIREGNLSFNNYKHFFPDEMKDNFLTQSFPRKICLLNSSLRRSSYRLAKFLDVLKFLEVQNLVFLIQKFCQELALPHVIEQQTLNTLMITLPKMKIFNNGRLIPNYEGRALSLILFQLKLFFGIDGKTEKYFSDCAQTLNQSGSLSSEMFHFMNWLQFLDYRNQVLKRVHFPSSFRSNKQLKNSNLFVKFILYKNPDYDKLDTNKKYNKSADDCRQLLMKLKGKQEIIEDPPYFAPSLSPSVDYVNSIVKYNHVSDIEKKILKTNFSTCSIEFIKNMRNLIPLLTDTKNMKVILGGANKHVNLFKLINSDNKIAAKLKEGREVNLVKVKSINSNISDNSASVSSFNSSIKVETIEEYLEEFKSNHNHTEKLGKDESLISDLSANGAAGNDCSFIHFKPHECYWINTDCNLGRLSKKKFRLHFDTYPSNFQFIVKEMARIAEQDAQDLLSEYSLTEIYLLYEEKFQDTENKNIEDIFHDSAMKNLLKKAKRHW
ncbi:hypothetical protein WA026_001774 [Henosepilachna vigintioctopunctata]|uniref:Rrn7/TAF1B C-terminal cyclin domain-containing protein n=1 Tax=Henosepilachna vigintioctopunctata TaxID=420089 RepID=A0AAW1URY7_9CUCU